MLHFYPSFQPIFATFLTRFSGRVTRTKNQQKVAVLLLAFC